MFQQAQLPRRVLPHGTYYHLRASTPDLKMLLQPTQDAGQRQVGISSRSKVQVLQLSIGWQMTHTPSNPKPSLPSQI